MSVFCTQLYMRSHVCLFVCNRKKQGTERECKKYKITYGYILMWIFWIILFNGIFALEDI